MRLESCHSGSYLEFVSTSSGGNFTTHLGVPHFSKWHDNPFSSISFLHLFTFSFLFFTPLSIPFYSFLLFTIWSSIIFVSFCSSISHLIITLYLCFSFCPLEVNLNTYLTTWLSLYPVGIFFGFSP